MWQEKKSVQKQGQRLRGGTAVAACPKKKEKTDFVKQGGKERSSKEQWKRLLGVP